MIVHVRGAVTDVGLSSTVVEVAGVGLEVQCTPGTLAELRVGQQATVPTSLVVREDSLTLFGFADDDERTTFEVLQTASGVGPKLAQAMLAVLGPDELRAAVAAEDTKTLTRVPGVGQKGAQRIILELADRLGAPQQATPPATSAASAPAAAATPWREQVRQGLVGLGWQAKEADQAVEAVADQASDPPDVAALLRAALRSLSSA